MDLSIPGILTWIVGGFILFAIIAAIIKKVMVEYYDIKSMKKGKEDK